MAALASAVLLVAAAALFHTLQTVARAKRRSRAVLAAIALSATLACGTAGAIAIRLLYVALAPGVTTFSMAFNIAADSVWAAANAGLVGLVLALARRKRASST